MIPVACLDLVRDAGWFPGSDSTAEATLPCLFFTTVHHKPSVRLLHFRCVHPSSSWSLHTITLLPTHSGGSNITPRLTNGQTLLSAYQKHLGVVGCSCWSMPTPPKQLGLRPDVEIISHKLHVSVLSLTTKNSGMLSEVQLNLGSLRCTQLHFGCHWLVGCHYSTSSLKRVQVAKLLCKACTQTRQC